MLNRELVSQSPKIISVVPFGIVGHNDIKNEKFIVGSHGIWYANTVVVKFSCEDVGVLSLFLYEEINNG